MPQYGQWHIMSKINSRHFLSYPIFGLFVFETTKHSQQEISQQQFPSLQNTIQPEDDSSHTEKRNNDCGGGGRKRGDMLPMRSGVSLCKKESFVLSGCTHHALRWTGGGGYMSSLIAGSGDSAPADLLLLPGYAQTLLTEMWPISVYSNWSMMEDEKEWMKISTVTVERWELGE